jgi:hypothetical protein
MSKNLLRLRRISGSIKTTLNDRKGLAYESAKVAPISLHPHHLPVCGGGDLSLSIPGQGTVYLLIRKRGVAHALSIILLFVSMLSVIGVLMARVDGSQFNPHLAVSSQYKSMIERNGLLIGLTVFLNIYGTLWLIGGALWSAYLFARKQVLPHRVLGNILIAVGALLPAGAGTLIRLGLSDWLYVSELLGAAIMFAGFVAATASQPVTRPQPAIAAT